MSRLLLFFLVLGCTTAFFSTLCAADSLLDGFWADDGKDDDAAAPLTEKAEGDEEVNIQKEKLNRIADEQPELEIRDPTADTTANLENTKQGPLTHVMLQAFDLNGDGRLDAEERSKIDKKAWLEFHQSMKKKAMNAIHNAMPTLKEMKQRLQQARFGGEIPKELFNKQKLQEKVDEQRRAAARNVQDAYPAITVAPGVDELHKRSLEHAKRYSERVKQEQKKA